MVSTARATRTGHLTGAYLFKPELVLEAIIGSIPEGWPWELHVTGRRGGLIYRNADITRIDSELRRAVHVEVRFATPDGGLASITLDGGGDRKWVAGPYTQHVASVLAVIDHRLIERGHSALNPRTHMRVAVFLFAVPWVLLLLTNGHLPDQVTDVARAALAFPPDGSWQWVYMVGMVGIVWSYALIGWCDPWRAWPAWARKVGPLIGGAAVSIAVGVAVARLTT